MSPCPQPSSRRQLFQSKYTPYICVLLFHYKAQEVPCYATLNNISTEYTSSCIDVHERMGTVSAVLRCLCTQFALTWQQTSSFFDLTGHSVCSFGLWLLHGRQEAFMRALFPRLVAYMFKCRKFQWFLWDIVQHMHECTHTQRHTYLYTQAWMHIVSPTVKIIRTIIFVLTRYQTLY